MTEQTIFFVALQASLILGLAHGVSPCGHSWLVLAPFVAGQKSGVRVALYTGSFILGTTLGCLTLGLALGVVSSRLPAGTREVMDVIVAAIIISLGAVLLWRPQLLHGHSHDHHDEHEHEHGHDHGHRFSGKTTAWGLAIIGFVNMIVPCPTAAVMYSYSLDSGSAARSVAVFASYALGTAVALAGVIFAIHRVAQWARRLQKPWIEPTILRATGVLTILFGFYSLYLDFLA